MRKWKRIATGIAIVAILCMIPSIAMAHPGRTDSNGGHYDRSTGEYHYHHGMEAHQHPGGVCPYDYASKYESESSSSSIATTPKPTTDTSNYYTIQPVPTAKSQSVPVSGPSTTSATATGKTTKFSFLQYVLAVLIVLAIIYALWKIWKRFCAETYITKSFTPLYQQLEAAQKCTPPHPTISYEYVSNSDIEDIYLDAIRNECLALVEKYKQLQPHGIVLDSEGLPHQYAPAPSTFDWYMVHYNPHTKVYHMPTCRYARTAICVHVTTIPANAVPCRTCRPSLPDMQWYQLRKHIELLMRIYAKHKGAPILNE